MTAKRGDRVAPPPVGDEWTVVFGTNDAARDWRELCNKAPGKTREAYELMRSTPRPEKDGRHGPLKGDLATRTLDGRTLEQWQIEVTGGGRIWYLIDDEKHKVWVVYASYGHPKPTDK